MTSAKYHEKPNIRGHRSDPKLPKTRRRAAAAAAALAASVAVNVAPHAPAGVLDSATAARWQALARQLATLPPTSGVATTPTSISLATRYQVNRDSYTRAEHEAATGAMDASGDVLNALSFVECTGFPGFPTLALLAQLPEYRTMAETLADETTRKWGKVHSTGSSDPARLEAIETELERLNVRAQLNEAVVWEQLFGRSHVYLRFKGDDADGAKADPVLRTSRGIPKGSLLGVRTIEAYSTTPDNYNSIDPTRDDFYVPSSWWVLGMRVNSTRMHTLISRPVPYMLKAAYSFAGVSMSQLAMPYVDNWLRTRQSVSDTLKQFSISGMQIDMAQALQPGGAMDLAARADLFNAMRDNRNVMLLDKETEEFFQFNTPLSSLDALQAQSQEQMASVSHIPLVKLLGTTPTGLNASSEGEIRVWYDYVASYQNKNLLPIVCDILKTVQLSLFGDIDPSISFVFDPLYELTELEKADVRLKDAQAASLYIQDNVITPEIERTRLQSDPLAGYDGLLEDGDLDAIPDDDIEGITNELMKIGPAGAAAGPNGAPGNGSPAAAGPTPNMPNETPEEDDPDVEAGAAASAG
ncbi:hypothetical protein T2_00031 [Ralstonia phage Elie]|uniref:Portal protein n=2 Tax=Bakolyvirus simangalove TaxID=2846051 RepID=A0A7G5BBR0_9CAUD|nr:portal protein [Ralstonia phage Adzire]YP_010077718.1 portal protein [Ralstonia phage Simangalove]QMV32976.1 hypothetical protein T2_00031 [Ralstonia phage Elie]QMV33688.1 portal protein [Ralstonia phage Sarlave]QMV32348.1 portal protein [Ralstonia phage Adzire]QMV33733.1 portal protein [Ralstonia phage Simangalove]